MGFLELDQIYIISLDDQTERRKELQKHGINANWILNYFSACDLRSKEKEEFKDKIDENATFNRYRRQLRSAEVGCALSHRKIYHSMIEKQQKYALILEDDILPLSEDYLNSINQIIQDLSIAFHSEKAFICHLGVPINQLIDSRIVLTWATLKPKKSKLKLLVPIYSSVWNTHAYLINLKAAKNILSNEKKVCFVADDWQIRLKNKTLDYLFVTDCIFDQNKKFDSTVQTEADCWGEQPTQNRPLMIKLLSKCNYYFKLTYSKCIQFIPFIIFTFSSKDTSKRDS